MFEAQLKQGALLKKTIDAIRDIVGEANLDCTPSGISMQSMDRANVVLVVFQLKAAGFDSYRCDRSIALGVAMTSLSKIMKCGSAEDAVTLKAEDSAETIGVMFEEPNGKVSDYELKLMDLDSGRVNLPEEQYEAYIRLSSQEFQRIVKDLSNIDDSGMRVLAYTFCDR